MSSIESDHELLIISAVAGVSEDKAEAERGVAEVNGQEAMVALLTQAIDCRGSYDRARRSLNETACNKWLHKVHERLKPANDCPSGYV